MEQNKIQEAQPAQEESKETAQEPTAIEQAQAVLAKIEEATKRAEENLKRQEDLLARAVLSGKSLAGEPQNKPKEETPQEYAKRVLAGNK